MRRSVVLIAVLAMACGVVIGRTTESLPHAFASEPASVSPYVHFVGRWIHHGGGMTISQNGHGMYSYRVYVFCNQQRTTACDKLTGNAIYGGGFSVFTLHRVVGNTAYGRMNNSAFSWQVGTRVTLVARANGTLVIHEAGTAAVVACGPKAPPGVCGA